MPRTRSRISTAEVKEYRDRLLRLDGLGIATGDAGNLSSKPNRFLLEQIDPELARVYDLPNGELVAAVPARLTILEPGVMIVDRSMTTTWDGYEFDLSDPREHEHPSLLNLTEGLYKQPPTLLYDFLAGRSAPYRHCQMRGVILATALTDLATRCDEPFLTIELLLRDEQRNETNLEFKAEVDRSSRQKYEREQQERRRAMPLGKPEGLYGTRLRAGDQRSISPKPNVGREHDAASDSQPSRSGRSIPLLPRKYIVPRYNNEGSLKRRRG